MARTRPGARASTRAFVALVLGLLVGSAVVSLFDWRPAVAVGTVLVLLGIVAVVAWNRRASEPGTDASGSGDHTDTRGSGTVWDAIPSWQYSGRHAESGGLTRDEQERALRDVQEEAERRERRP